ncbi:MAG TPA: hypothetical protein VHZ03_08315, partial [Trebonia sp.]|nr:hypothetical protein [Trebonia sp.]
MMLASLVHAVRLRRTRRVPGRPAGEPAAPASTPPPGSLATQAPPAETTETASGMRITDKRSAAARAAAAGPTQSTAAAESPARQLWAAGLPLAAATLCFTVLGLLIQAGRRTPLPGAPATEAGRCAWRRAACRQVLRDRPARPGNLAELIALAADGGAGDWREPVLWWAKRRVSPAQLTSFVQAELVATPRSAITGRR